MSQEIQEAVYRQQEVIKDKQLRVKQDLDQVEPAVIEAQNGTCSRSSEPLRSSVVSVSLLLVCSVTLVSNLNLRESDHSKSTERVQFYVQKRKYSP